MKPQEKRLLLIFLGLVLAGAIVILFDIYREKKEELLAERTSLENEWITIETLFEEKEKWEMRGEWLSRYQPEFTNDELAAQSIFKESLAEEVAGVVTSRQALLPVTVGPYSVETGVAFVANGSLPATFRWLYDLTPPTSFRVVKNLKIVPEKENPENVVTRLELLRWYAPTP